MINKKTKSYYMLGRVSLAFSLLSSVLIITCLLSACGGSGLAKTYDKAQKALAEGQYETAIELFESISTYEDSSKLAVYAKALLYGESNDYVKAIETLNFLGDFKDSRQLLIYFEICASANTSDPFELLTIADEFDKISSYRDSKQKADICRERAYEIAVEQLQLEQFTVAREIFEALDDYKDSKMRVEGCNEAQKNEDLESAYLKASALMESGDYSAAILEFSYIESYKDSHERMAECHRIIDEEIQLINEEKYNTAISLLESGNIVAANALFAELKDYKDSADRSNAIMSNASTVIESAEGRIGPVTVKTVADKDTIFFVEILEHEETEGIGSIAVLKIAQEIIDAQNCDIDAITGATESSNAVKQAVSEALKKIRGQA